MESKAPLSDVDTVDIDSESYYKNMVSNIQVENDYRPGNTASHESMVPHDGQEIVPPPVRRVEVNPMHTLVEEQQRTEQPAEHRNAPPPAVDIEGQFFNKIKTTEKVTLKIELDVLLPTPERMEMVNDMFERSYISFFTDELILRMSIGEIDIKKAISTQLETYMKKNKAPIAKAPRKAKPRKPAPKKKVVKDTKTDG